jgi:hypothetical protein
MLVAFETKYSQTFGVGSRPGPRYMMPCRSLLKSSLILNHPRCRYAAVKLPWREQPLVLHAMMGNRVLSR